MVQSGESFTFDDVTEALKDVLAPEAVTALLLGYRERQLAEQKEAARMLRMVDIIDEYDELLLLDSEGGCILKPDDILNRAHNYLAHLRDTEFKDDLDKKARLLSLYILATLDGPYSGGEMLVEEREHHQVSDSEIKILMKRYVIDKFGLAAWSLDYDELEFIDLFDEMRHFDGESFIEILRKQPLLEEIREELDRQGYIFRIRRGEV